MKAGGERRLTRDTENIEYKKTTSELNAAMNSISAILNKHRSGTLYFGMRNDGTPYPFTITDSTIWDVSRKVFESIRPQIFPAIYTEEISGVEVIRVDFKGEDTPYSAFGRYYMRTADEDRELSPSELRNIMINREYEENWENHVSSETIHEIDEDALERFYREAVECGRMPEMSAYDKVKLLKKLGLLSGDRLTNAGRMLFSGNKPIVLKLAVFATEQKLTFLDISRYEGNIFSLIDIALGYVMRNIRWRVVIEGSGASRKEIPEIPADAVREAIVNSFAHARYDLPVQHEIDIFSDRVSIVNPGSFANEYAPSDFVDKELHSFLRNEKIANVLYLCKKIESFGSGIKRVYSLCENANVGVTYSNEDSAFVMELHREDRNRSLSRGAIYDSINGSLNTLDEEWSKLEAEVFELIRKKGHMSGNELMAETGKSRRTISRTTSSLLGKGLIRRVGSKKTGYYAIR